MKPSTIFYVCCFFVALALFLLAWLDGGQVWTWLGERESTRHTIEQSQVVPTGENRLDQDPVVGVEESFAFVGLSSRVSGPSKRELPHGNEQRETDGSRNSERKPPRDSYLSGLDSREEIEGVIPDMYIDPAGWSLEEIARHYGFLLIAVAEGEILGKLVNGRFDGLVSDELRLYSMRGRRADGLHTAPSIKEAIGRRLGLPQVAIDLVFLVPKAVEERFVEVELRAIRAAGLRTKEVKLVDAYYDSNMEVRVRAVITKNNEVRQVPDLRRGRRGPP